jgi:hypothetical protein
VVLRRNLTQLELAPEPRDERHLAERLDVPLRDRNLDRRAT